MENENRLIRPGDLIATLRDDLNINGKNFARVKRHIENAPTVDAVPVVRCKDCIHALKGANGDLWCYGTHRVFGMYYCASGERRE